MSHTQSRKTYGRYSVLQQAVKLGTWTGTDRQTSRLMTARIGFFTLRHANICVQVHTRSPPSSLYLHAMNAACASHTCDCLRSQSRVTHQCGMSTAWCGAVHTPLHWLGYNLVTDQSRLCGCVSLAVYKAFCIPLGWLQQSSETEQQTMPGCTGTWGPLQPGQQCRRRAS